MSIAADICKYFVHLMKPLVTPNPLKTFRNIPGKRMQKYLRKNQMNRTKKKKKNKRATI